MSPPAPIPTSTCWCSIRSTRARCCSRSPSCKEQIEALPGGIEDGQLSAAARAALELHTELRVAEPEDMTPGAPRRTRRRDRRSRRAHRRRRISCEPPCSTTCASSSTTTTRASSTATAIWSASRRSRFPACSASSPRRSPSIRSPTPKRPSSISSATWSPPSPIAGYHDRLDVRLTRPRRCRGRRASRPTCRPMLAGLQRELAGAVVARRRTRRIISSPPRRASRSTTRSPTTRATASQRTTSVRAAAMDLCLAIHRDFTYDRKSTNVDTPPLEAFDLKQRRLPGFRRTS